MIRLSTLLLAPPVGERLRARYDDYRQHGASWLSASLGCLWASLVWALMPLETPRWQAILAHHETYFPILIRIARVRWIRCATCCNPCGCWRRACRSRKKGQLALAGGPGRGARSLYAMAGETA